ncbi:MAG TPA: glycosyltransferase family 2 protein [Candidatus Altiarchaeales archaeon]|nr:glycosyltransferase family 2 protein [Candidatus Altiarchaeales archaeon]
MFEGGRLAVIVPAYNEGSLIAHALSKIADYADYIIVVDDGSTDDSAKTVEKISEKDKRITLIRHDANRGVGAALSTGYLKARELEADYAIVMAGDAQMDGRHIPKLLKPIVSGEADYVKGNRLVGSNARRGMPKFRLLGNSILTFLTKVCSGYWDIMDPQNGYTAASRQVIETIDWEGMYPRYGYPNDLLIKLNAAGFKVADANIPAVYGMEKSKIRYATYIPKVSLILLRGFAWRLWEKYVIRSFHPLVLFYLMGFTLIPISILTAAYLAYLRFYVVGGITATSALIPIFLFTTGLQSLFFAMLFDMEAGKK